MGRLASGTVKTRIVSSKSMDGRRLIFYLRAADAVSHSDIAEGRLQLARVVYLCTFISDAKRSNSKTVVCSKVALILH